MANISVRPSISQKRQSISHKLLFSPTGKEKQDAFLSACEKGNIAKVKAYIIAKNPFDIVDAGGRTPLMLASKSANIKVFTKVLSLTTDKDLHAQDNLGMNAYYYSCYSNSLSEVTILKKRGLKFADSQIETTPAELSSNPAIIALMVGMVEEYRRLLSIRVTILADCISKFQYDDVKLNEEVFRRTGLDVQNYSSAGLKKGEVEEVVTESFQRSVLDHPTTRLELKDSFEEETPQNWKEASRKVRTAYGVKLDKKETKQVLQDLGVQSKADALNDPAIRKEISKHFKANRPNSVQEAIEYIQEKYGVICKERMVTDFLKACGHIYEAPPAAAEVEDVD